jgi:hypothetical protein
MQQKQFMDKYPIFELTLSKSECRFDSVGAIIDYLITQVETHPKATFIAQFDHLAHTRQIEGEVNPDILAAGHVIFCFGTKLPNAQVMAVRPRSIGVTEFSDHFVVNFMEPPMPVATEAMESWVKSLQK